MRVRLVLMLAVLAAGTSAASARAHDPAEQPVRNGTVFLPFPAESEQAVQFLAVVGSANREGFAIRVAVISSSRVLDEYTSYWRQPGAYAQLLGGELKPGYAQRLLVVMPNGFGFNWPEHSVIAEYAILRKITIGTGHDGLLAAAQTAIQQLAAASSLRLTAPARVTTPAQRASHDRLVIVLASLGALAGVVVLSAWRRRRSPR